MRQSVHHSVASWAFAACAVLFLASPATLRADAPVLPDTARKLVERAATALAKAGRKTEMAEALTLAGELGTPAPALAKLRDACEKTAAKTTKIASEVPDAAKLLRQAAADMATVLPSCEGAERERLARRILAIDGRQPAAHQAVGHVLHEKKWVPPMLPDCLARRAEIADAVRAARRIPVEFETGESPYASIQAITGKAGIVVKAHGVALHSGVFPKDKLERILGHSLRALALSEFLCGRELKVPDLVPALNFILYASEPDYLKATAESLAAGGIDAATAARSKDVASFWDRRGYTVGHRRVEASWEADLVVDTRELHADKLYGTFPQPCLEAGHINWVLLQFVGRGIPGIAWVEEEVTPVDKSRTSDRALQDERIELFRLSKSSLMGARAWLQWLARRSEDPAWSKSMVPIIGKITGNDLTKTTFVVEYLHETRRFDGLCRETLRETDIAAAFEKAIEEPLGDFERRWREWLLPDEPGLADRVDAAPATEMSADEKRFLAYLDNLRTTAIWQRDREIVKPLRPENDLSAACRLHALYLVKHPDQLARWPDAHEEYPDKEGFSAQGCRAGLSSVIAPGVATPEQAIDGWMGTFYHRLPLLDPGLLRVGFGMEKGVAVLDTGSMVAPVPIGTYAVWPAAGAKDVPRRFQAELPNPVPGADQSQWGYPVTAQFFSWTEEPKVRITLSRDGRTVDCHLSTPDQPTNTDLAPRGAFCLIPKAPLAPLATYTVTIEDAPQVGRIEWTFTTAK